MTGPIIVPTDVQKVDTIVSLKGTKILSTVIIDKNTDSIICEVDTTNLKGLDALAQDLELILDFSPDGGLTWSIDAVTEEELAEVSPYPVISGQVGPIGIDKNTNRPFDIWPLSTPIFEKQANCKNPIFRYLIKSKTSNISTVATTKTIQRK